MHFIDETWRLDKKGYLSLLIWRLTVVMIQILQEPQNLVLGHDVQADRRFIQVQDRWFVKQRGRKIAPHLLSQAEFAHRLVNKLGHIHQIDQEIEMIPVSLSGQFVHGCENLERVDQW